MGKSKKYHDDYLDYDEYIEDNSSYDEVEEVLPYVSPKKEKKLSKATTKQAGGTTKREKNSYPKSKSTNPKELEIISNVPVETCCNKCGHHVKGDLLGYFYQEATGLNVPFIQYYCPNCQHEGRRSVYANALPSNEFDRKYF